MEKSLNQEIKDKFAIADVDIRTYSPLTLAYLVNQLHHKTSHVVKAHSQAIMAEALMDVLTDTEKDIYRRGRNAKSHTMAKNATVTDYRSATGFEALMGYLYLTDQMERMMEVVSIGLERCHLL